MQVCVSKWNHFSKRCQAKDDPMRLRCFQTYQKGNEKHQLNVVTSFYYHCNCLKKTKWKFRKHARTHTKCGEAEQPNHRQKFIRKMACILAIIELNWMNTVWWQNSVILNELILFLQQRCLSVAFTFWAWIWKRDVTMRLIQTSN